MFHVQRFWDLLFVVLAPATFLPTALSLLTALKCLRFRNLSIPALNPDGGTSLSSTEQFLSQSPKRFLTRARLRSAGHRKRCWRFQKKASPVGASVAKVCRHHEINTGQYYPGPKVAEEGTH